MNHSCENKGLVVNELTSDIQLLFFYKLWIRREFLKEFQPKQRNSSSVMSKIACMSGRETNAELPD